MSSRWKIQQTKELRKLASDDSWCLPSSTSRGGSSSALSRAMRATELKQREAVVIPGEVDTAATVASSNVSTLTTSNVVDSPTSNPGTTKSTKKPAPSRVLVDTDLLKDSLESHIVCPLCKSNVVVSFPTVCLASSIRIQCNDPICTFVEVNKPTSTASPPLGPNSSPNKERNIDYAVNILFVLGFLTSGDGGKEASKLLGLLGLPNTTTMEKRSWPTIERSISPVIQKVTDEIMEENLHMAVEHHYGDRTSEDGKRLFDCWKDHHPLLEDNEKPKINVSADMGWQGRSSGVQYNSASGHASLVEQETRLVVALDIKSKICNVCTWYEGTDRDIRPHECVKNHVGSSGSMEPQAILDMVVDLYDRKSVVTDTIITDDDSSIKAKLKWSNEDYMMNNKTTVRPTHVTRAGNVVPRPDKGGLPGYIPEPKFLADPNHRKKTLRGVLYGVLKKRVAERHGLTKVDVIRLVNNFAYMIRTLHQLEDSDAVRVDAAKAVLEHHFDNHKYCSTSFCKRKNMTPEERKADTEKIYRCPKKDAKLYSFLHDNVLARFVTKEALHEVAHSMDTQVNESLNNSIAWLAPKNKTYCGSISLRNRICVAIGIASVGTLHYFRRIFESLQIKMTADVEHYLVLHGETRDYRITKCQEPEAKRLRNTKLHEQLKKATIELKGAIAKEGGVYQPGIGLDGGYEDDTQDEAEDGGDDAKPAAKKRKVGSSGGSRKCSACGESGHNRSNRMCSLWKPRGASKPSTTRDSEELDLMDQMAFAAEQDIPLGDADSISGGALSGIV